MPPDTISNINISLDLAGSISGFIYDSTGVIPIPGVGIMAVPIFGRFGGIGAYSSWNGSYILTNLPSESYTVEAWPELNWYIGEIYDSEYIRDTADTVNVTAGDTVTDINFYLAEGGAITGHVYDEETGDPLEVQMGAFSLNYNGHVIPAPSTSPDGDYRIVLRPGSYLIQANIGSINIGSYITEWYDNAENMENATPVTVTYHHETAGIDFYLARIPGNISGHIYDVITEDSLADATVYAFPVETGIVGGGANSDSNGYYEIWGLNWGNYIVKVTLTGYIPKDTNVTVAPYETTYVDFGLERGPRLVSPAYGSFINDNTPTFHWSDVSDANKYHLQVDNIDTFPSPLINEDTLIVTAYTSMISLNEGLYYWRVRAWIDTSWTSWTRTWSFTIDTQSPTFSQTTQWSNASFDGPYPVTSIIADNYSLSSVFLYYRYNRDNWQSIIMNLIESSKYMAEIPEVPDTNTTVDYYLEARDLASNTTTDPVSAPDSVYSFYGLWVGITEQINFTVPNAFALYQNHPNPFVSTTTIKFALPKESQVSLRIYDMSGRLVETLVNATLEAGYHNVDWNSEGLSAGIYFIKLKTENHTELLKAILLR